MLRVKGSSIHRDKDKDCMLLHDKPFDTDPRSDMPHVNNMP